MGYAYLDMLKVSVPASIRASVDDMACAQYVLLGSYDLLYYDPRPPASASLTWLEECHERRHGIDWNYERHPVFLYCPGKMDRRMKAVMDEVGLKSRPLVLTMVRVAKHPFCDGPFPSLDEALASLQAMLDDATPKDGGMSSLVCWNLGNCDFMIASRPIRLGVLREVLINLGRQSFTIQVHGSTDISTKFTSFSSYCAFCRGDDETAPMDADALEQWLNAEAGVLQFIDFVDALPEFGASDAEFANSRFLLGDRDFQFSRQTTNTASDQAETVLEIARQLLDPGVKPIILASSLVPSLSMPDDLSKDPVSCGVDTYGIDWDLTNAPIGQLITELEGVKQLIEGVAALDDDAKELCKNQIDHCINTLGALFKHAQRLYAAAYQDDYLFVVSALYESLACLVANYKILVEVQLNDDRYDSLVMEFVSDLYMEVMRFVSELQHLNAILAVSPHSYMETYYGSMRSLNASSKLWVSYNGVMQAICSLFAGKQVVRVLLVPYRELPSQSRQFFLKFHVQDILLLMQLNYKMMFDTQASVYTIAHELGHYIYNATRYERLEFLFSAVLATIIDNDFRDALQRPFEFMMNSPVGRKGPRVKCLNVYGSVSDSVQTAVNEAICDDLLDAHIKCISKVVSDACKQFVGFYVKCASAQGVLTQHYGTDVVGMIAHFLAERDKHDEGNTNLSTALNEAASAVANSYVHLLENLGMYEQRLARTPAGYPTSEPVPCFDAYQVVCLRTYWAERSKTRPNRPPQESTHLLEAGTKDALEVFREIHADIFACKVTNYTEDDYFRYVARFADAHTPIITEQSNLMRIMAVCACVFGDRKYERLLDWIGGSASSGFAKSDCKRSAVMVEAVQDSCYWQYYLAYADKVCESLDAKLVTIKANADCQELLEAIRDFARSEKKGAQVQADLLWRFWLYVIRNNVFQSSSI